MANSRLSMRKILEVLRLHHEGNLSHREIARAISASPTTVGEILRRAKLAGVTWPLPAAASEAALEARLYPPAAPSHQARPEPNWPAAHRELRRKGVTTRPTLAGIQGRAPRRLWLKRLLRTLPGVGIAGGVNP